MTTVTIHINISANETRRAVSGASTSKKICGDVDYTDADKTCDIKCYKYSSYYKLKGKCKGRDGTRDVDVMSVPMQYLSVANNGHAQKKYNKF